MRRALFFVLLALCTFLVLGPPGTGLGRASPLERVAILAPADILAALDMKWGIDTPAITAVSTNRLINYYYGDASLPVDPMPYGRVEEVLATPAYTKPGLGTSPCSTVDGATMPCPWSGTAAATHNFSRVIRA